MLWFVTTLSCARACGKADERNCFTLRSLQAIQESGGSISRARCRGNKDQAIAGGSFSPGALLEPWSKRRNDAARFLVTVRQYYSVWLTRAFPQGELQERTGLVGSAIFGPNGCDA
jgi:hypothetical protein